MIKTVPLKLGLLVETFEHIQNTLIEQSFKEWINRHLTYASIVTVDSGCQANVYIMWIFLLNAHSAVGT